MVGGGNVDSNALLTNLAKTSSVSSILSAVPSESTIVLPYPSPAPAPITSISKFAGYQRLRGFLPSTHAVLATGGTIGMSCRESAEPYCPPRRGLAIPPLLKISRFHNSSP